MPYEENQNRLLRLLEEVEIDYDSECEVDIDN